MGSDEFWDPPESVIIRPSSRWMMISEVLSLSLGFLLGSGILFGPFFEDSFIQKPAKGRRSSTSEIFQSQLATLKLEDVPEEYHALFESEFSELGRQLKFVIRQLERRGMSPMEVSVVKTAENRNYSLGLAIKNFVPVASGVWDSQDVLSFQAMGEGPVYINLTLLQRLVTPLAGYRSRILSSDREHEILVGFWHVILEKSKEHSIRFEGLFETEQPIVLPFLYLRNKGSELKIEADGSDVEQALSRGTFPLPPLNILGGQSSSTKLIMEFFDKD